MPGKPGQIILKWIARVVGLALIVIADSQLKEITEAHHLESGIVGTYRAITLLLAYYLFWVFTRRFDGSFSNEDNRGGDDTKLSSLAIASFALFTCVSITSGFLIAHAVYVEAIDRSVPVFVAQIYGFITYLASAGFVLWALDKTTNVIIDDDL